ncbi:MAG: hypothetical protein M1371_07905, partial [Actinobacteria bacterium]|nr:hypothetical protein [Actinomycetota bacterium]
EWGIRLRKIPYKTLFGIGYYNEIIEHPLADDDAINSYAPPDPSKVDMGTTIEVINKYGRSHYIAGDIGPVLMESTRYLRGDEQTFIDLVRNRELIWRIMDMLNNYYIAVSKRFIEMGVDSIWMGDDLGAQYGLMISPQIFRKVIKPKMAFLFDEIKKMNSKIKIIFHSDGCIYEVLDDLVEVGVNILHPIQPESMDPVWIKRRYGNELVLAGTIGTQSVLPFGSVEEVKTMVRDMIRSVAPGGGLWLMPSQNVQLDTPEYNIEAFYQAAIEYGKYPICTDV